MLNSSRQLFGYTKDDLAVETLTLDNGILSCDIITFGAALRSLRVPDRSGIKRDVVLGYDRHFIDPRPIDCTAHLWAAFHNGPLGLCLDSSQPTSTCCVSLGYCTPAPPT